MDSLLTKGITYGVLDRALQILGFQEETHETHRLYKKEEQGAVIVLPRNINIDEPARAVHLLTVRHTLAGKGILGKAEFEQLLTTINEGKMPLSTTTNGNGHAAWQSQATKTRMAIAAPPVEVG